MKKILAITFVFILSYWLMGEVSLVNADWWQRSDVRPTQPSTPRDNIVIPTSQPTTLPTVTPSQPTTAPTVTGNPNIPSPTQGVTNSSSSSTDDPCAPGKSYYGPHCGWSPEVEGQTSGGSSNESLRIGGPSVLGLSYTGGEDLKISDIILLTGILCLSLYIRSKLTKKEIA